MECGDQSFGEISEIADEVSNIEELRLAIEKLQISGNPNGIFLTIFQSRFSFIKTYFPQKIPLDCVPQQPT